MEKSIKKIYIAGLTILAILIVVLCSTIHARSASAVELKHWNEYYAPYEREFVSELRGFLNSEGYTNAGITMTHTVDGEGNREYTVQIHHMRMSKLDEKSADGFAEEIKDMAFADERCSFVIVLD